MGNVTGRMEAGLDDGGVGGDSVDDSVRSNGDIAPGDNHASVRYGTGRVIPAEVFPMRFRSPMLISPQIPIALTQTSDGPVSLSQTRQSNSQDPANPKQGIPISITWNYGGSKEYVPEYPESIAEFEAPPSPESSYSQVPSCEENFAKEPIVVPPQLHLTVLGPANAEEPVPSRPQHVVLNHLFLEKGRSSQSVVALGLTHRFKSKYVTVILYKPVKREKEVVVFFLSDFVHANSSTVIIVNIKLLPVALQPSPLYTSFGHLAAYFPELLL